MVLCLCVFCFVCFFLNLGGDQMSTQRIEIPDSCLFNTGGVIIKPPFFTKLLIQTQTVRYRAAPAFNQQRAQSGHHIHLGGSTHAHIPLPSLHQETGPEESTLTYGKRYYSYSTVLASRMALGLCILIEIGGN